LECEKLVEIAKPILERKNYPWNYNACEYYYVLAQHYATAKEFDRYEKIMQILEAEDFPQLEYLRGKKCMVTGHFQEALNLFEEHEQKWGYRFSQTALNWLYSHRARCFEGLGDARNARKAMRLSKKYGKFDKDLAGKIAKMKQKSVSSVRPYLLRKCSFLQM